jgi:hypothetical protein
MTSALRRGALRWRAFVGALLAAALPSTFAAPAAAEPLPPLFPIRQGDLHGLIDAQGRQVLAPEYTELKLGQPWVMLRKGHRTAYADGTGRLMIEPQDELTQPFADGLVPMRGKDAAGQPKWGYADAQRRFAIPPAFDDAQGFVDGLAVVGIADAWGTLKYGAVDRSGKLVVPASHDKLVATGGGLVRAESRERTHRVFDARGRDLTPAGIDFVGIASDGMVRVWSGRSQGFMTLAGELTVPPRFQQASDFKEGHARVWVDGKFGFIDRRGALVVPARYDVAEDFSDGLALVKEDGQSKFVDGRGRVVLTPQADRVWPFSQGLAAVKIGNQHGFIDKQGRSVIAPQFSHVRAFHNGLAFVVQGRTTGYIRPDGQFVWRGGT